MEQLNLENQNTGGIESKESEAVVIEKIRDILLQIDGKERADLAVL